VATLVSFMFFAVAYHERPFESSRLNFVKTCSEFQLFGILLICVVLQSSKIGGIPPNEIIRNDGYGVCQLILTLAIIPVTGYVLRKRVTDMRVEIITLATSLSARNLNVEEEGGGDESEFLENPVHETFEAEEGEKR
jgi:hypothetical protein